MVMRFETTSKPQLIAQSTIIQLKPLLGMGMDLFYT